jgi:hypothetical protein
MALVLDMVTWRWEFFAKIFGKFSQPVARRLGG